MTCPFPIHLIIYRKAMVQEAPKCKKSELADYSAYIITEYYNNNIQPFLNAFSDMCLWIGPAEGQMIRTKKELIATFSKENNQLTFAMQNLQIISINAGPAALDVILTFTVITYYPNGKPITFQQRLELLWVEETLKDSEAGHTKDYFIRLCHISNEFPYDDRDTIYPNHFDELAIAKIYTGTAKMNKTALKGLYGSYFYLSGETIMWLESKRSHSLIYTNDKVYESIETVSEIVAKYPATLYKIHASYAVNPAYVSEIGRFYVCLTDGKKLNIPEKKYTKTRDELNRRIDLLKD